MCVVSMVMDHYWDKWNKPQPVQQPFPFNPYPVMPQIVPQPQITPEEVAEFKRLLERAREYDKKHNEPDCELEEKKSRIKQLADSLGVDINFL